MKQERDTHNNYFVLSQDMVLISRGRQETQISPKHVFGIDCLCLQHEPANGHKLVITIANYLNSNQRLVDTKPCRTPLGKI